MPSYDIDKYRSLFPHLKAGLIYFDHAAVGPFCKPVLDALNDYLQRKSETQPNIYFDFLKKAVTTKEQIGTLLNCSKERIAFTDSTTNGLNILAAGLEWKSGDRILLTDIEFPANVHPFLNQKRHGVEVDFVRNVDGTIPLEAIERALTPKTKLLSVSFVQFLQGFRADLASIGSLCKEKGILFCVDAIQGAGASPLDVKAMNIDFLSCGCQKWLLAPEGTAFVYASEETQSRIHQAHFGWTSIGNFFGDFLRYRMDLDPTARRYENGTLNASGILGLHASLGMLMEIGIANIEEHLRELTRFTIERLKKERMLILTPEDPKARAGIVSFRPSNAQDLFEKMKANKIVVSLREGCIRLSPHFYNTKEEIGKALDLMFTD